MAQQTIPHLELNHADRLPASVQALVRNGIERLQPRRVLLYGSRARGDHHPTSDFDLAFEGVSLGTFGFWQLEVDWDFPCVWPFDVVSLDHVDSDFAEVIRREGLVLYDAT